MAHPERVPQPCPRDPWLLPLAQAFSCPHCGNVYAEDSLFCRKCGKPRAAQAATGEGGGRSSRRTALVLYNSFTGEPEEELEYIDLEKLHSPTGIDYVESLLNNHGYVNH